MIQEMCQYIIEVKSGTKMEITVRSGIELIQNIKLGANKESDVCFYADGGFMLNIAEISAIYPKSSVLEDVRSEFKAPA